MLRHLQTYVTIQNIFSISNSNHHNPWPEQTGLWWGSTEKRHKQRDGTWAGPLDSLPWNLPFCVQTPASTEQRRCWPARVQPTTSPTSTGCYFLLSSYLRPQCLGGTENPGPQSHPHPGRCLQDVHPASGERVGVPNSMLGGGHLPDL